MLISPRFWLAFAASTAGRLPKRPPSSPTSFWTCWRASTWIADSGLPFEIVLAGAPLHRVHRLDLDAIFFGPGHGAPPTYRFDSPTGALGVLYVGVDLDVALVETLARNPSRRMIAYADVAARASTVLRADRPLRIVQLYGAGLQKIGCENAISTGPHDPCGVWPDVLWRHQSAPDGVA